MWTAPLPIVENPSRHGWRQLKACSRRNQPREGGVMSNPCIGDNSPASSFPANALEKYGHPPIRFGSPDPNKGDLCGIGHLRLPRGNWHLRRLPMTWSTIASPPPWCTAQTYTHPSPHARGKRTPHTRQPLDELTTTAPPPPSADCHGRGVGLRP